MQQPRFTQLSRMGLELRMRHYLGALDGVPVGASTQIIV